MLPHEKHTGGKQVRHGRRAIRAQMIKEAVMVPGGEGASDAPVLAFVVKALLPAGESYQQKPQESSEQDGDGQNQGL